MKQYGNMNFQNLKLFSETIDDTFPHMKEESNCLAFYALTLKPYIYDIIWVY